MIDVLQNISCNYLILSLTTICKCPTSVSSKLGFLHGVETLQFFNGPSRTLGCHKYIGGKKHAKAEKKTRAMSIFSHAKAFSLSQRVSILDFPKCR